MIWIIIKLAFLGAAVAAFVAFAVVWLACCLMAIGAIRRLAGIALALIYALVAAIIFAPGYFIAGYALRGASPGQTKFFWAVAVFYFLVFISRKQALPEFLAIARRQTAEWNARPGITSPPASPPSQKPPD